MHKHCPRPIVMPLSNPTSRVEATPQDIIQLDERYGAGRDGSPFTPVTWNEKTWPIAQCNNHIFPGIGLGVIACGASRITDDMLMSASETLAKYSPLVINGEGLVFTGAERYPYRFPRDCLRGGKSRPTTRCCRENVEEGAIAGD